MMSESCAVVCWVDGWMQCVVRRWSVGGKSGRQQYTTTHTAAAVMNVLLLLPCCLAGGLIFIQLCVQCPARGAGAGVCEFTAVYYHTTIRVSEYHPQQPAPTHVLVAVKRRA